MNYMDGDKVLETRDCGCLIFQRHSTMTNETKIDIHYCPKHEASNDLYEALDKILKHWQLSPHLLDVRTGYDEDYIKLGLQALSKADGGK